jgi:uncharacterized protein
MSVVREKVRFISGDADCAAWFYPGTNGACVIMTGGFGVTKEPATDPFAKAFNEAGFAVLAFEYRRLGESGGEPRLVLPLKDQFRDWQAAIEFAATLPGVARTRLAIWGFSAAGGHVLRLAARNPRLAAAIAQAPNADNVAAARRASRYQTPLAMLRFVGRGLVDMAGGLLGRRPLLVPLTGEPGTVALLTTPDGRQGVQALSPGNRYPDWQRAVAARSALSLLWFRPGTVAPQIQPPLLVVVCDDDRTAGVEPSVRVAERAPRAELVRLPGGHYAPFLSGFEQAVAAELDFLRRHVLDGAEPNRSTAFGVESARA